MCLRWNETTDRAPLRRVFHVLLLKPKLIALLQVQPELNGGTECRGQPERRVRRDAPLAIDDASNAVRRHTDRLSKRVCAQVHGLQVLLKQDLPWMDGTHEVLHRDFSSALGSLLWGRSAPGLMGLVLCSVVVIDDLDICRALGRPAKANSELIVDPDRMLPGSVAYKRLKSVARRRPQVEERGCGIEHL